MLLSALILGLIGGVFGIAGGFLFLMLGSAELAFSGGEWEDSDFGTGILVTLLAGIVGTAGAGFSLHKPVAAALLMVGAGIVGLITGGGFFFGGVLLLVAGVLAFLGRNSRAPSAPVASHAPDTVPSRTHD